MKNLKVGKKKKQWILIVLIILFVIAVICATFFSIKAYTTNEALNFLSEKYNVDKEEFELVDYEPACYHILQTDSILKPYTLLRTDYQWQFKREDKEFIVTHQSNRFYDDYQLEDIENWSTQWLQKNVDSRIIGVTYSTKHIINYQKSLGNDGNQYVFDEENIIDFINSSSTYTNESYVKVYYLDEDAWHTVGDTKLQDVDNSIKKVVPQMDFITLCVNTKYYMKTFTDKDTIWYRGYICEERDVLF